ncbi:unnamed protein product [Sphagnum tenellum]
MSYTTSRRYCSSPRRIRQAEGREALASFSSLFVFVPPRSLFSRAICSRMRLTRTQKQASEEGSNKYRHPKQGSRITKHTRSSSSKSRFAAGSLPHGVEHLVPFTRSTERTSSVLQQQHHAVVERICSSLLLLQRSYQAGVLYFLKLAVQPLFLYTIFWTLMLAATVAVSSLSLEMGFRSSISPSMEIAEACSLQGNKGSPSCRQCFSLPLDGPSDGLCVPANLFKKSRIDIAVPPIFAGLVVAASALFVQGLGLWTY